MLSLFSSRRTTPSFAPRRHSLQIEPLEDRTCPAAPTLNYTATEVMGQVRLQGLVADDNPNGFVMVSFSGAVTQFLMQTPGSFDVTVPAFGTGLIHGTAYDSEGLNSGAVDALFSSQAPGVTFSVTYGANRQLTIIGHVTDEAPANTTVTIGGAAMGMITPNADGSFSITVTATQIGELTVTARDAFGQSTTASTQLTNTAPTITDFQVSIAPGRFFTFTGKVTDENAEGLMVTFGGLNALMGKSATVDEDGNFSVTVELGQNDDGEAQARVTDWWGLQSELATLLVI